MRENRAWAPAPVAVVFAPNPTTSRVAMSREAAPQDQDTTEPLELKLVQPRVPDKTLVYAIGDIHGRVDLLEQLHAIILEDAENTRSDRRIAVYLGDAR